MLLDHDKLDLGVDSYYGEKIPFILHIDILILIFYLFILFDMACLQTLNSPKNKGTEGTDDRNVLIIM